MAHSDEPSVGVIRGDNTLFVFSYNGDNSYNQLSPLPTVDSGQTFVQICVGRIHGWCNCLLAS